MDKVQISVLTPQTRFSRGFSDFFPLIKWNKSLREKGIKIAFHKSHEELKQKGTDILIIDYRYGQRIEKLKVGTNEIKLKATSHFIFDLISRQRKLGTSKIIFFDTRDSAGSESLDVLPFVDVFLKKQMFVDKTKYLKKFEYNFMVWLPSGFSDTRDATFKPALIGELPKMRLGWNIGLCDFRVNSFTTSILPRWIPFGNRFIKLKFNTKPLRDRKYLLSYRGTSNQHPSYDYQRNFAKKVLKSYSSDNLIIGDKVPKNQYLKELELSKAVLSPFGWGEVCYRDFECILNGSLMIKPDVSHIKTYPDLYKPSESYIKVDWEMNELHSVLSSIESGDDYSEIISYAQELFHHHQSSFSEFHKHLCSIIY